MALVYPDPSQAPHLELDAEGGVLYCPRCFLEWDPVGYQGPEHCSECAAEEDEDPDLKAQLDHEDRQDDAYHTMSNEELGL